MGQIKIKRVYESPSKDDGTRILVDRLWPRGISREKASIDIWLRETAPSSTLRKWFSHDPAKWQQFRKKYLEEITSGREEILKLREYIKKGTVTLLYAAKDNAMNNAVVLRKYLESEEQKGKEG